MLGKLKMAMALTFALLFGTLAAILGIILWLLGPKMGIILGIISIIGFSAIIVGIQWLLAPWLLKVFIRMREIPENDSDYVWLHEELTELSKKAGIKKPKLFIVQDGTPNAFAFGRTKNNSNVALHTGLLEALNKEEISAVLAHEVGHIKHWDVVLITIASMVPLMIYYTIIFFGSLFTRDEDRQNPFSFILIWIGAMIAHFMSSLIVMHLSRTREYYADAFSAVATKNPKALRTALAKISYGFPMGVKTQKYEGTRAFYIADPINSSKMSLNTGELEKDIEKSEEKRLKEGSKVSSKELSHAIEWEKKMGFMEFFSTHPMTYKRIDSLEQVEKEINAGKLTMQNV